MNVRPARERTHGDYDLRLLARRGADVWRPVDAELVRPGVYRIVGTNADPETEHWQFQTGELARCEEKMLSDNRPHRCLVAVERVGESS